MKGVPLNKVISVTKKLSGTILKKIIFQICKLLEYLHSLNILYRDLKLPNVLVDRDLNVSLIDFGLSKILKKEENFLTKSVCGTPHCLPPQVNLDGGSGYGLEIDYFSLGILIFEISQGYSPLGFFQNFEEIQEKYTQENLDEHTDKISQPDLKELISGLVRIDEGERLGSKNGFSEILEISYFSEIQNLEDLEHGTNKEEKEIISEIGKPSI